EEWHITLGDMLAIKNTDNVTGAFIATGDNSSINHTGVITVQGPNPTSLPNQGRGASIVMGDHGNATFDEIHVEAEDVAIGLHFFANDDGWLEATDKAVVAAQNVGSSATGVGVRASIRSAARFSDIDVTGGTSAYGIDFNVADEGHLSLSGDVNVNAEDTGSVAYGVVFGAKDDFVA